MQSTIGFALILLGILASAFFSGLETGLISLNRLRLRHEVERKNRRALILNGFVENTERLLGTTLVGNSLANVIVGVFASAVAARCMNRDNAWVDFSATFVAAALLLVFGEIVPKTLFRHYPHRLCMTLANALEAAAWLFAPFVALVSVLTRAITGAGRDQSQKSVFVTREELKYLAKEGEAGGALTAEEREMIHGVFDFRSKTVYEAMIPLARTVTVTSGTTARELFDLSQRTGFARFPVREGDKITGIVSVYDILFENENPDGLPTAQFMRKPQFVVSTERIDRALPMLRASRRGISVVVDPEARHVGIISIEDIVEEIVGDVEG